MNRANAAIFPGISSNIQFIQTRMLCFRGSTSARVGAMIAQARKTAAKGKARTIPVLTPKRRIDLYITFLAPVYSPTARAILGGGFSPQKIELFY
jgi:hypothetical protein